MDSAALLDWFRPRRRLYPWRRPRPDPYHVLVSEIMLQQTQAARVVPAFRSFIRSFPTVEDLAATPRRGVLLAWAGLGYNRRAVWLSESARRIVVEHAGEVPARPDVLDRLPGIGPYTAAAIASIAYGMPVPAVGTNVRRVVARAVLGVDGGEPSVRTVCEAATDWMDGSDPAAWNQAVMDLGREICRPAPRCERCPLAHSCAFRSSGRAPSVSPRSDGVPFHGSFRQLRGTVIGVLRDRSSATLATLCAASSQPPARVVRAGGGAPGRPLGRGRPGGADGKHEGEGSAHRRGQVTKRAGRARSPPLPPCGLVRLGLA